jgi:hypothetical protein
MGVPLYYDIMNVVGRGPLCPGVTDEEFFPSLLLPYLPLVLGLSDIELRGPDVRSKIKGAVARNRQLAARIDTLAEDGANYGEESLQNMRCKTVLQAARFRRRDEPQLTTSILRRHAGERTLRRPHFDDELEVHSPVVGSPQFLYLPPDGDQLTSPGGPEPEMGSEPYNPQFQERGEGGSETSGPSRSTIAGSVGGGSYIT